MELEKKLGSQELKQIALNLLEKNKESVFYVLLFLRKYKSDFNSLTAFKLLTSSILSSKNSDHWSSDSPVNIGYFDNEATFFTLLFHEVCHLIIREMIPNFNLNIYDEEKLCNLFSKKLCFLLKLPFSYRIVSISSRFLIICQKLKVLPTPANLAQYEKLAKLPEAEILSFNLLDSQNH